MSTTTTTRTTAIGIALRGRWHFGSHIDSVKKGIAGYSGEDDHPQQVGDRPLHEILAGDSATTRLQTPSPAPPPAATTTRQQIGTGQRAGHNEGTTTTTSSIPSTEMQQQQPLQQQQQSSLILHHPTTVPVIPDLSNPHFGEPG
jgi:hypothetical protein